MITFHPKTTKNVESCGLFLFNTLKIFVVVHILFIIVVAYTQSMLKRHRKSMRNNNQKA